MGFRTFVELLLCDCWPPHWQHNIFKTLQNFIGFSNCALIYLMNWLKYEHLVPLNAINESEIRMKSHLISICVQTVQIMLHAFKPLPFQCQCKCFYDCLYQFIIILLYIGVFFNNWDKNCFFACFRLLFGDTRSVKMDQLNGGIGK